MQGTRPLGPELSPPPGAARDLWRRKLAALSAEDPSADLGCLHALLDCSTLCGEDLRDQLSTELMRRFRDSGSRACFGLLYELNWGHLFAQVTQRLRRYQSRADAGDLLQEVFFNVYRYPRNFDAGRPEAFRVWTATIVRNTVLKHLRSLSRSGRAEVPFEDLSEQPESSASEPLGDVIEQESENQCRRVYLVYLHLYLHFYKQLSQREQTALRLVEVDEVSYRDAAEQLGIRLENLKMVIFRARRKIYRAMKRVFEGLPADFRPAREPREAQAGRDVLTPRPPRSAPETPPPPGRVAISRRPGASVAPKARAFDPAAPKETRPAPKPTRSQAPNPDESRTPCAEQASREDHSR